MPADVTSLLDNLDKVRVVLVGTSPEAEFMSTVLLRFLGIILRVLRLEVPISHTMFTITIQFQTTFAH